MIAADLVDEARRIAAQYRQAEPEHAHGWWVWLPGASEPCGWTARTEPIPSHYTPGVLAVDEAGRVLVAVGGNAHNGAKAWREVET